MSWGRRRRFPGKRVRRRNPSVRINRFRSREEYAARIKEVFASLRSSMIARDYEEQAAEIGPRLLQEWDRVREGYPLVWKVSKPDTHWSYQRGGYQWHGFLIPEGYPNSELESLLSDPTNMELPPVPSVEDWELPLKAAELKWVFPELANFMERCLGWKLPKKAKRPPTGENSPKYVVTDEMRADIARAAAYYLTNTMTLNKNKKE